MLNKRQGTSLKSSIYLLFGYSYLHDFCVENKTMLEGPIPTINTNTEDNHSHKHATKVMILKVLQADWLKVGP